MQCKVMWANLNKKAPLQIPLTVSLQVLPVQIGKAYGNVSICTYTHLPYVFFFVICSDKYLEKPLCILLPLEV